MAYLDDVRELRAKMTSGALTRDEAAQELSQRSNGGLTVYGAMTHLDRPTADVEADYERAFANIREMTRRLGMTSDRE